MKSPLESKMNYQFKNPQWLNLALTHSSFANENNSKEMNNEKLEYLGDAVLDLVIGDLLFNKFPESDEGSLSKRRASLVNEEVLAEFGAQLNLSAEIRLGKGEFRSGGAHKPRLLASTYEAVLGALYKDAGFEGVKAFITSSFEKRIEELDLKNDYEADYKTKLQEFAQGALKQTPSYQLMEEVGPSHDRQFKVCVKVGDEVWGQGSGRTKKAAEQVAARIAMTSLREAQATTSAAAESPKKETEE